MQAMKQVATLASVVLATLAAALTGCGSGTGTEASPPPPALQNVTVTGQYNLVLTSTNGNPTTNIYTFFTQTGVTFAGATDTLVCPSNDLSQCQGDDGQGSSIIPSGTVSGANVTIVISVPNSAGAHTVTLVGSGTSNGFAGTYKDSRGDSGTWIASAAIHPFGPPAGVFVYAYTGSFNSTSNPLLIPPTISLQLGEAASPQASSDLAGVAAVMNSPCASSLTLSGRALGDALRLTDATSRVSLTALPSTLDANSFKFSYKFESDAPACAGDFGNGQLTFVTNPWDY